MIRVLCFGAVADRAKGREFALEADRARTVAEALEALGLADAPDLIVAVNQEVVQERARPLADGDELALMPPFSGG